MTRHIILSLVAVSLVAGCGEMPTGDQPDTKCDTGAATVTMAQLQTAIFDAKCKSCHFPASGGMPEGSGFAYGDYTTAAKTFEMVNKKSLFAGSAGTLKIVEPNNLANSSLWLKVSTKKAAGFKGPKNENTGARMPNDGSPFSDAEIKQIKDWICTGATM